MPSTTTALKHRIGSVRNTRQITKAMELVSASKMRRAQEKAKLSRDYQIAAYDLLARLSSLKETQIHPLFTRRQVRSRLYVIITSNSGLAGAYNYNVLKAFTANISSDRTKGIVSRVITVGSKGAQFVRRLEGVELMAVYPAFGDDSSSNDLWPLLDTLIELYRSKSIDEASLVYTIFVSNMKQQATVLDILPAQVQEEEDHPVYKYSFTNFEPSVDVVLESVAARLLEIQIWQAVLESLASEHSMRMVAMKNATDNANDLIDDLQLAFNTARQSAITQELAEITGGAEAIGQ